MATKQELKNAIKKIQNEELIKKNTCLFDIKQDLDKNGQEGVITFWTNGFYFNGKPYSKLNKIELEHLYYLLSSYL